VLLNACGVDHEEFGKLLLEFNLMFDKYRGCKTDLGGKLEFWRIQIQDS
jgi:hypothetical protein